jgi:hypothetical protein
MTHDQEDQLVLDAAWDWLVRTCGFFSRQSFTDGAERVAQLWRWNGHRGPLEDRL